MSEIKYKPCPFCGFTPKIVELKDNVRYNYKIRCTFCGVMFYENTVSDCIARWNTRLNERANNDG